MGMLPTTEPPGTRAMSAVPEAVETVAEMHFNDELSRHIDACYSAAKSWRDREITPRLQDCLERRQGRYDASKLHAIRQLNSVETFFNLTEAKAAALEAWVNDVLADRPWDLEPSPIPDLPPHIADGLLSQIEQQYAAEAESVMAAAEQLPAQERENVIAQLREKVAADSRAIAEQVRNELQRQAKERAERMTKRVEDQLAEGGWADALAQTIQYLATYPYAVLKGPYIVGKRRLRWSQDGSGSADVVEEPVLCWASPNPWDIYWDPSSQNFGDSYVIENSRHTPADLQIMAQSPGWIHHRLDQIIRDATKGRTPNPPTTPYHDTSQRAMLEQRPQTQEGPVANIEMRNWWGVVPGSMLLDWAYFNEVVLEEFGFRDIRPDRFYAICAAQIGRHCVKAYPNPDPLGRVPYMMTSFEKVPGAAVGRALPEKMSDCQDGYNVALRSLANNLLFAAAPMIAYDAYAMIQPITRLQPMQIYPYNGTRSKGGGDPIHFNQPTLIASKCIEIAEYFAAQADDRTSIPKYIYGDEGGVRGAAATASGLSMLRGDAAKGVKRLLGFLDRDIIRPSIDRQVAWNNLYSNDPELKGDVHVVSRGSLYAITRDTQQMRQLEAAQFAEQPGYAHLVRDTGRAMVLRSIVSKADIPEDKFVLTDEEVEMQAQHRALMQQQQMEMAAQQGAQNPAKPNTPTPNGRAA